MAVRRRAKGWEIVVEVGRDPATGARQRRTEMFVGTKKEALRRERNLQLQLERGVGPTTNRLTLAAFLHQWLETVSPDLAESTRRRYEQLIRLQIVPRIGAIPLAKLTPLHVQNLYSRLAEEGRADGRGALAPRSRLHVHRLLFAALSQAVRWQMVPRNVCGLVQPPQVRASEMHTLDADDVRRLLGAAARQDDTAGDATALAVLTGLRLGELLGLRWSDIDFERRTMAVRRSLQHLSRNQPTFREPKTKRSQRTIYWGATTREVLDRLRLRRSASRVSQFVQQPAVDLLFVGSSGEPLSRWTLRDGFHRFLEAADLPRIRFHDLRHTYASLQIQAGTHAKLISENLGHSSINTTMDTYGHVFPGLQALATESFEMWLASDGEPARAERQQA